MKNKTLLGVLAVALLFVAPYFALISYFAYFNKDLVYLRAGGPAWMLNPEDKRVVNEFPSDFPATYTLRFNLESPPAEAHLKLYAVSSHELKVNGVALSTTDATARANWKSGALYEIGPYLSVGQNTVSVYVRSPYSVTALKSEGEVLTADGGRVSMDSGLDWLVQSKEPFPQLGFFRIPQPPELVVHPTFADKLRSGQYWPGSLVLFAAAVLITAVLFLLPGMFKGLDGALQRLAPESVKTKKGRSVLTSAFVALVFAVLALTLFNNLMKYPAQRTGDYQYHLEYLRHFLTSWRVPLAPEGFQMYNPPLYYLVSAKLFNLFGPIGPLTDVERYAQSVNTVSAFLTVVAAYMVLKRLVLGRGALVMALATAAFLPMNLYKAPNISGDNLNALLCTLSFLYWLLWLKRPRRLFILLAGVFSGLGFLTRYTTLFPIMGICAGFAYVVYSGRKDRKEAMICFGLYGLSVLTISGWYYIRNLIYLHKLFPIAGTPDLFFFRQVPGFRDWDFYTNIFAIVINDPVSKMNSMESFFAGSYNTFWFDGQHFFLTYDKLTNIALPFTALALALLPTALIVWGLVTASRKALGGDMDDSTPFMVACLATLSLSLVAYTLGSCNYPFYSIVKAHYILFCFTPIICLLGAGLESWTSRSGNAVGMAWIIALCAANLHFFFL